MIWNPLSKRNKMIRAIVEPAGVLKILTKPLHYEEVKKRITIMAEIGSRAKRNKYLESECLTPLMPPIITIIKLPIIEKNCGEKQKRPHF